MASFLMSSPEKSLSTVCPRVQFLWKVWLQRSSPSPVNVWAAYPLGFLAKWPYRCVSFRTQLFSICLSGSPFGLLSVCNVGRPSEKRTNWTNTCASTGGRGPARWPVISVTRASSALRPWRATWSSIRTRRLILAFFAQNPLTALICWRITWPFISMMAASRAQLVRNDSQILSRWVSIPETPVHFSSLVKETSMLGKLRLRIDRLHFHPVLETTLRLRTVFLQSSYFR